MAGRVIGFFGRMLRGLWRVIDVSRRVLLNLVFLLLIALLLAVWLKSAPSVPDGAALVLHPSGAIVEEATLRDPLQLVGVGPSAPAQTVLRDLLDAIDAAREDARIRALVIETDDLEEAGLSKLAELRAAIAAFKAAGKPVFARGERFMQGQYYLASVADEVHVAPDGFVLLRGLARNLTYFKGALDALGVQVHVFRVGQYKSFSEPFTRSGMSPADRAATKDLLDGLWNGVREDVAAARRLQLDAVDRYVNQYPDLLVANEGDAAKTARAAGLVDRFSTRDEWRTRLVEEVGASADGKSFRRVELAEYLAERRAARPRAKDQVAVLVARGAIVDGSAAPGSVGGDTLARQIRAARENERVKALVLRIDSPGGSAWASEVIRRELELTRKAGKPVVASMSSVAASGGYWIAAGADEIWASPATLTGSIGVFALFPVFAEPLDRLGITVDGVATGPLAGALDPRRPLDPAAAQALQSAVGHSYRRFIRTVAEARDMKPDEVETVAQGRVWTGRAASDLGLVDKLGGLDAAIAAAAARAKLERYEEVWPEQGLSPLQRLLRSAGEALGPAGAEGPRASPLGQMLAGLQREAVELQRWNDPRHIYTHCLCEAP